MGEHRLKEQPGWQPIPEDPLANAIWIWVHKHREDWMLEGTVSWSVHLADFIRTQNLSTTSGEPV